MTRVVVCGTGFGRLYLYALSLAPRRYALDAIVARGSRRSLAVARHCGVPLARSVGEIGEAPDLAVVAVGGRAGFELCGEWLERGVDVLLEHPVEPGHLGRLLASAKAHGSRLHVNTHFADLAAPRLFLARAAQLARRQALRSVSAGFNLRTLYSGVDLLAQALAPRKLGYAGRELRAGRIPVALQVAARRGPDDASYVLDGHRICLQFERCELVLGSAAGPVFRLNLPGRLPVWQLLSAPRPPAWTRFDPHTRAVALLAAIDALRRGGPAPLQRPSRLLGVSRVWRKTLDRL